MAANEQQQDSCLPLRPTYSVAYGQLQDLVRAQNSLIARLRYMLEKKSECVSKEEYEDLKQKLQDEVYSHMETKTRLVNREKELEFALTDISILSRELKQEKDRFNDTYKELKGMAEMRNQENNALLEKCTEITEVCGYQDDILTVKDKKIRDLQERLAKQAKNSRIAENEAKLRLQQERYLIGHNYVSKEVNERPRKHAKGILK